MGFFVAFYKLNFFAEISVHVKSLQFNRLALWEMLFIIIVCFDYKAALKWPCGCLAQNNKCKRNTTSCLQ